MNNGWYVGAKRVYQRPEIRASAEIVLSVFAVALLLSVAIRPTLATVAGLKKKIADQELVDKKLSNKLTQLALSQKALADYKDRLYLFQEAVPNKHEYAKLAQRFELLALENGVAFEVLSFGPVPVIGDKVGLSGKNKKEIALETKEGVASVELNFSVSGDQQGVLGFVRKIESMDRVLMINSLVLQKEKDERKKDRRGYLKATATAKTYYVFKPDSEN
ncbi:type 4a pilus biogenesis protein PilO [Candidatus Collierbacteria bacterium]|nr:type 4a pilus biogenesis protein PilO [Candidatus Collierbacteria bacterium]